MAPGAGRGPRQVGRREGRAGEAGRTGSVHSAAQTRLPGVRLPLLCRVSEEGPSPQVASPEQGELWVIRRGPGTKEFTRRAGASPGMFQGAERHHRGK